LSVHERAIWLDEMAVAKRFVGAAGGSVGGGVGVGAGVGVGVAPAAMPTTNLKLLLVDRMRESIIPDVRTGERSLVDVVMQYCTDVPAGWAGITAE
jgi:hypothetical protein